MLAGMNQVSDEAIPEECIYRMIQINVHSWLILSSSEYPLDAKLQAKTKAKGDARMQLAWL